MGLDRVPMKAKGTPTHFDVLRITLCTRGAQGGAHVLVRSNEFAQASISGCVSVPDHGGPMITRVEVRRDRRRWMRNRRAWCARNPACVDAQQRAGLRTELASQSRTCRSCFPRPDSRRRPGRERGCPLVARPRPCWRLRAGTGAERASPVGERERDRHSRCRAEERDSNASRTNGQRAVECEYACQRCLTEKRSTASTGGSAITRSGCRLTWQRSGCGSRRDTHGAASRATVGIGTVDP